MNPCDPKYDRLKLTPERLLDIAEAYAMWLRCLRPSDACSNTK